MAGKCIPDFIPRAEESGILKVFREVARTGKAETIYDFCYEGMDGRKAWWNWTLVPVMADGTVVAFAHMLVDVTEQNRAHEALKAEIAGTDAGGRADATALGSHCRIAGHEEPQQLVDSLCRKIMAHLDCHMFFNFLVDEPSGRLRLNACGGISEEAARQIEWLDYRSGGLRMRGAGWLPASSPSTSRPASTRAPTSCDPMAYRPMPATRC